MEHTAGHLTKGEYKVKLPDGRVQVVSYEADHAGFRPRDHTSQQAWWWSQVRQGIMG